jgi:hypothetical protein
MHLKISAPAPPGRQQPPSALRASHSSVALSTINVNEPFENVSHILISAAGHSRNVNSRPRTTSKPNSLQRMSVGDPTSLHETSDAACAGPSLPSLILRASTDRSHR